MKSTVCSTRTLRTFLFAVAALFTVVHARAFWSEPQALSFGMLQPSVRSVRTSDSIIKFDMEGGKVRIYVNGRKQKVRPGAKQIEVPLRNNDVVAFKCTKTASPTKMAGLMATITYNGKTYRTGVDRFSTHGGFSKWPTWEKKYWDEVKVYEDKDTGTTHDFCHWKDAHKVDNKWKTFDAKASFIWGLIGKNNKEVARTVFIRFVVGGETCSGKSLTTGKKGDMKDDDEDDDNDDGKDDEGKGKKKGKKEDDDDDEGKGKKKGNKKDDDDDDDDGKGGKKKGSKKEGDDEDDDGKSKKNKGNKKDDDDNDGDGRGEKEGKKKDDDTGDEDGDDKEDNERDDDEDDDKNRSGRVPHPKDKDDDEGENNGLSGQSDSGKADGFCACKLTVRKGGECYDMEDPNANSGRCKPRACEPKFECVVSSETMCVKRHGGSRVVMVSPNNCMTETADDVEMLLPYEG